MVDLENQRIFNNLYAKQKEALKFFTKNNNSKLSLLATGTGKTITALSWLENLIYKQENIQKVFIVTPACKTLDWYTEIENWKTKEVFREFSSFKLKSSKTNYENVLTNKSKCIFIISHQMFRMLKKHKKETEFKTIWSNSAIIFDEASILKKQTSEISKIIWTISKIMKHQNCLYLTATPTSNKQSDIYLLLKLCGVDFGYQDNLFMDKKKFEDYFLDFKMQKIWNPYKHISMEIKTEIGLKPEREKEFFKLIHLVGYTLTLEELKGEIPKLNYSFKYLENSTAINKAKRIKIMMYDSLKHTSDVDKLKKYNDEYDILLPIAPTAALMYERQICSGFISNQQIKNFNGITLTHPKLDYLETMLNGTNENIIIFYNFQKECIDIETMIKDKLPDKKIIIVNGNNKYEKSKALIDSINSSQNYVLIGQIQACGIGLNLDQFSHIAIYYSPCLSLEQYLQSLGRINRVSQKLPCFYYFLVTKNTIEEEIYDTLRHNQSYTDKMYQEKNNIV